MALDLASMLNSWADYGIFSYAIPFMLIFALVYGLLAKMGIFGDARDDNGKATPTNGIYVVIALAVALMGIINDWAATFFAELFPRASIALGIFLVLIIFVGFFFFPKNKEGKENQFPQWIGWVLGIGVILWAWIEWGDRWGGYIGAGNLGFYLVEYLPMIIVVALIVVGIMAATGGFSGSGSKS
jgi:hypothetical protein